MISNRAAGAVALVVVVGIAGCLSVGSDTTTTNTPLDPAKFQSYVARNYSKIPVLTQTLSRIVAVANGGSDPGITFSTIPGGSGVQGTVAIDLDQNGSADASIDAKLVYANPSVGIAGGATFTINSINAPYVSGSAVAQVAVVGNGTQVNFTSGTADLTPTQGPHISVPSASLTVTPTLQNPTILGHVDYAADNTTGTMFFESNGSGGYKIRTTGSTFTTFTYP